jgi:hypothetical protein
LIVAVSFAFLTPRAAVLIVLALVPLGAIVVAERRVARVRSALGLDAPAQHRRRAALVAAAVLAMVIAAMQPVVKTEQAAHARTDAQAFVVIDTSRSMAAAASPSAPKRLARAKRAAIDAAAALGDVPIGVATFTDRVLPILFPTANRAAFDSAVEALTIEDPPPRDVNTVATSFGALAALGTQGFFPSRVHKRAAIVVTDGESRPFDPGTLASTLSGHGIRLAVVPVGTGGDRVFRPDGKPEAAYRPDPKAAAQSLARLGGLTPARLRQALGSGPSHVIGVEPRTRSLAPIPALLALLAVVVLLGRDLPGGTWNRIPWRT